MLSKLIPAGTGEGIRPFNYRVIDAPAQFGDSGRRAEDASPSPNEAEAEINRLRAEIAGLKQALVQQVATARDAALREGETRARAQLEVAMRPIADRLNASIQEVIAQKPRLRKEVEEEAVRLALAIARRILRREVTIDSSALQGLVQVALERAGRQDIHRVIANPEQVQQIRSALAHATNRQIEIVPDSSRPPGTVILETARGSIDASIESQLQEIENGLADRLRWR